jgi:radical SAM protein with 4Fe4S-binding SPASM domain
MEWVAETCKDIIPIYHHLEFNLTGGEPLLYPYLWDVVETIKTHGAAFNLLTNGILIDDRVIDKLRDYGVNNVQVSVEGLKEVHDWVRGPGTFDRVMTVLDQLISGYIKITVASTITKRNYKELTDFLDFFSTRDVHIGFHRYIPVPPQCKQHQMAIHDPFLWERIVKQVVEYKETRNPGIVMNDPLFGLELIKKYETRNLDKPLPGEKFFGCSIGVSAITVMPDGTVYPCRKLPISLGNTFEIPLIKIWLNSKLLWKLRDRSHFHGKCGACNHRFKCGGCRAGAYSAAAAENKSEGMFNADHLCFN